MQTFVLLEAWFVSVAHTSTIRGDAFATMLSCSPSHLCSPTSAGYRHRNEARMVIRYTQYHWQLCLLCENIALCVGYRSFSLYHPDMFEYIPTMSTSKTRWRIHLKSDNKGLIDPRSVFQD